MESNQCQHIPPADPDPENKRLIEIVNHKSITALIVQGFREPWEKISPPPPQLQKPSSPSPHRKLNSLCQIKFTDCVR